MIPSTLKMGRSSLAAKSFRMEKDENNWKKSNVRTKSLINHHHPNRAKVGELLKYQKKELLYAKTVSAPTPTK